MGITVRSVFSKSRSVGSHDSNNNVMKNSAVEKRKWSSVRSYLCGDGGEFNSIRAEEVSASVKSSEASLTQPTPESSEKSTVAQQPPTPESSEATVTQPVPEEDLEKKQNSTARLFCQEDAAATVIQSAFRGFLDRRRNGGIEPMAMEGEQELVVGEGSPSRKCVGISIEAQNRNSTEVFSTREEIMAVHPRLQQKSKTSALKIKEDWDDSTVSSNIVKMRIQNRLEATTRRERALAYAFSQQLRICSKKKQNRSENGTETNMGWSWLERWMATRLPESSPFESYAMNQIDPTNISQRSVVRKKVLDVSGEEKESCGSNEVSVQFDSISVSATKEKDESKPTKNRFEATRSKSMRKIVLSHNCPREHSKGISKKDCPREDEKVKQHKQMQAARIIISKREIKCKDAAAAASQLSPDGATTGDNSKLGH